MRRKFYVSLAAAVAALITFTAPSFAKKYPDRPIRVIIPLPPGGSVDIVARLLQPLLEKSLGQSLVIDNRSGASGIIVANAVATASPYGYTLLRAAHHVFHHRRAASEAAVRSVARVPAGHGGRPERAACAGQSQVAATSLQEFVALAKANPATRCNYSTPGASRSGASDSVRAVEPAGRHQDAAQSAGATRDQAPAGVDYGAAGICRGRLPDGLWRADPRQLSAGRRLRRRNSARRRPPSFRSASRPNSTSSSI